MISGKSQSVVVCQPDHIRHRPVILYGLMGCHIYLLGPVESLTLQSCFETKVFVGAVSHTASITHCQKLEVSCAVKQVWIKSSAQCQLNLHNQYKTVLHSSKGIVIGPMNFTYDGLRRDIKDGGIDTSENLFDEFVHWSGPSAESIPGLVGLLQPSAFHPQTLDKRLLAGPRRLESWESSLEPRVDLSLERFKNDWWTGFKSLDRCLFFESMLDWPPMYRECHCKTWMRECRAESQRKFQLFNYRKWYFAITPR